MSLVCFLSHYVISSGNIHEICLMTLALVPKANHPEATLKSIRIFPGKRREYLDDLIFKSHKWLSLG